MFWVDVVAMEELARKAAGMDVSLLDGESLMADAAGIARVVSLLEATVAHLVAELDARGVCEREVGLSTGSWLARESGQPKSRARRSVKVGRGLRALAVIDDAVADGRLTSDHAAHLSRLVTPRVADAVTLVQDQIVEWAADRSFEIWARQVSALVDLLDQDGGHDPERDDPRSELHVVPTTDGVTFLRGQLAGADAVLVRQAIESKADELFHRYKRDRDESGGAIEVPARSVLMAEALVELCRLANARDAGSSKAPRPDVTLIVRAGPPLADDGLPEDGDGGLDDDLDRRGGVSGSGVDDRADVAELDGEDRADGADPGGGLAGLLGPDPLRPSMIPTPLFGPLWPEVTDLTGVRLQDATTRALLCDPDLHALIVDGLGTPLDLGRTARFANDDQRRALLVRDGGCIFPGCDRPPGWCDAHHVKPYDDGGLTDLGWLALLCRRHHGISHRRGWIMHATDDHWYWWTAPNGHTFWSQRHGHRRSGPTPAP